MTRWSDVAEWRGPTVNEGDGDGVQEPGDSMYEYRGVVVHIAEGTYEGTISWQRNSSADVSSHFVVGRSGAIAQVVDTAVRAWTQSAGNGHWISIENEGFTASSTHYRAGWEFLTAQAVEANARLLARAHREHGVPLQLTSDPNGHGLGWHGMGGAAWGGHYGCPGEAIKAQLPQILARAIEIVNGDNDMDEAQDIRLRRIELSLGGLNQYHTETVPLPGDGKVYPIAINLAIRRLEAASAADATRDAGILAAVTALANAGGVDAAPIVAAIKAEAAATRALVEERHQAEMDELHKALAALKRDSDAEIAGLTAELAALKPAV